MPLFHRKSAEEKQLDAVIRELQVNMSNNYKDNAVACFREFSEMLAKFREAGALRPKDEERYEAIRADYEKKMVGYSHNAQKPYWTKEDMIP